jgi:FtsP/CotA-like multicopper oxidase with cupredoxin domain
MTRRDFLALAAAAPALAGDPTPADITLRISEINAEIGPGQVVRTTAYNGQTPGPLLRMTEGTPVSVDVVNETRRPELVHWHGLHLPPEVDGAHEEGTPMVQGRDRRRYTFTPRPAGTRWYHTHAMAGHNLTIGSYSGQFGMLVIGSRSDPARYDVEFPVILHEWDPFFVAATDLDYRVCSINGRMLGTGEPLRVHRGQRALLRVLNASATNPHRIALPGHRFQVVALDGNIVPTPRTVSVLELAPGERIDAIVEMNQPGVWILGETDQKQRASGAGIVVEYAGAKGGAQWTDPPRETWDLLSFASAAPAAEPEVRIPIVIEQGVNGSLWAINGKSFPQTDPIILTSGARNRLAIENRGMMDHPVHTHRYSFEIARYVGKTASGVKKDVVTVPMHQTVEVDLVADSAGPALFHCHNQFHMDFGFMALMRYL